MDGLISFGNKRNYEDFKKQIPVTVLPLFDSIREFCFNLGENVLEDIRMHRVVFCKSMTFRWFLDVEPEKDGVKIKIQKSRKDPIQIIQIKKDQKIYLKNICFKRPGTGISPMKYKSILGKKAKNTLSQNTLIKRKDLKV